MRIAFDASPLETPHPTGVERAARELLRALAQRAAAGGYDHDVLLVSRGPLDCGFALPERFRALDLAAARAGRFWRERLLAPLLERERVDLLHSFVGALPLRARCRRIATFHEVPWREERRLELARRARLAYAARRARWLIAVSERTRALLVAAAPRAAGRAVVVHHGVEARFTPGPLQVPRAQLLAELGLPDVEPLLFVGAARPRKELPLLVQAHAALPLELRHRHPLLLAGVAPADAQRLRAIAARLGAADSLHAPGFVRDEQLPDLYRCARALVLPSRFEGFGLPVLEAMASGTPVVTTTGGALPEVAGDAALLVAPGNAGALRGALARVLQDEPLRAGLRARGLARAAGFTWARAAEQVVALHEACA